MLKQTLALIGLTLSLGANAATVTYEYTGQTYEFLAESPYNSSMTIESSLSFDLATTANLSFLDRKADLTSYSIFDGVRTLDSSNSTFLAARFETNSLGSITAWSFQLSPGSTPNNEDLVIFRSDTGCYDYTRMPGRIEGCSNRGPGTFTGPSAVPIPAAAWLFGSALLGLGLMKRKIA
jgi:hypothetical protein